MAIIQAPRGTEDVLPAQAEKWVYLENTARDTARLFGFGEIRFPTFEYTELFARGVGETTDVVQKEMFSVSKKGSDEKEKSFTLRPEGTAPTVRAVLQHGLYGGPLPLRLFYLTSCFRGERPQAGRLREFHQFGVELFGAEKPAADVEVIALARAVFEKLGVEGLRLEINSIGCPDCRKTYHDALRTYFEAHAESLCETCRGRLATNPMRILDCKNPECKQLAAGAPRVLDYICSDCRAHFEGVQRGLGELGIAFTVNPAIVRGLDYYTRTVFEFVDEKQGLTLCGGGRYDGLVQSLGGPQLPALGFGMGLERLLLAMEAQGCAFPGEENGGVYFAPMGDAAAALAAKLAAQLREEGFSAEYDLLGRSVKAQMKYADKRGFGYAVVIGDEELRRGEAALKSLRGGENRTVKLDGSFTGAVYEAQRADALENLAGAVEHSEAGQ